MNKFIPVYEFCNKYKISKQNIYRWIREGKLSPDIYTKEVKTVERYRVDENKLASYAKDNFKAKNATTEQAEEA